MRLRTRLLMFFQGALAVVLAGFSISLHAMASKYLLRQADERLDSALNTLAAATEIHPTGVEWEPEERSLRFNRRALEGGLVWRVADGEGRRIDGSGLEAERPLDLPPGVPAPAGRPLTLDDRGKGRWRVMRRRLVPSDGRTIAAAPPEEGGTAAGRFHPELWLSAGVSLDRIRETLDRLSIALAGLSAGLWLAMMVLGGRLCRRALKPVSAMADAAHDIGGEDLDRRLPPPGTGDELEELGRSFNALLDRLQESFERQRRFTGDASHQLRTPLTTMLGNVDLALKQPRTPEEYVRTLTLVQAKARQMRGMIESLLFLARADAESVRPRLEPMDLRAWLEDFLASRPDTSRCSDIRVEVGDDGPFVARAHPALLGDLLESLLENAEKYSEPGTPIVVRLANDRGSPSIAVVDRGIGVDADDLPRLFEPFYRSRAARRRAAAGVGLGLSIALRLARALGTALEASSRPSEGSSFRIVWHRNGRPESEDEPAAEASRDAASTPTRAPSDS